MPYSDRQLAHLSAMGLVAWVERVDPGQRSADSSDTAPADTGSIAHEPPAFVPEASPPGRTLSDAPATAPVPIPAAPVRPGTESIDSRPDSASSPAPSLTPPPVLPMPMPREPAVLASWLPAQPLAPFVYRERTLTRVGREDAPLLVVVERGAPAEGLPLMDAAAELFERMLRAIGMTRRDTRQCVLSAQPAPADADTVGAFALAPYRAALVLMQELDAELDGSACRFPLGDGAAAHPAWCLPHPDRLLLEPRRKAQAWQVLKALRRHLDAAA